jgi:hypothetical protein
MRTNGRWWLLKLNFVFLALCFMGTSTCGSQGADLEYINIQDSVLVDKITEYIELRQQEFPYFKDKGYLQLKLLYTNRYSDPSLDDSLKAVFVLQDSYRGFKNGENKSPKYFTYIRDKLVLIYLVEDLFSQNPRLDQKSRELIVALTSSVLEPIEPLIVKDSLGNVFIDDKYFRPEEKVMLHTGGTIKIYKNGSMELSH